MVVNTALLWNSLVVLQSGCEAPRGRSLRPGPSAVRQLHNSLNQPALVSSAVLLPVFGVSALIGESVLCFLFFKKEFVAMNFSVSVTLEVLHGFQYSV